MNIEYVICNDDKDNLIAVQQDFACFSAQMNIHCFQGRVARFAIFWLSVPSLLLLKHYNSPAIIDNNSLSAGSVAPTERAILPKMLAFSMDVILTWDLHKHCNSTQFNRTAKCLQTFCRNFRISTLLCKTVHFYGASTFNFMSWIFLFLFVRVLRLLYAVRIISCYAHVCHWSRSRRDQRKWWAAQNNKAEWILITYTFRQVFFPLIQYDRMLLRLQFLSVSHHSKWHWTLTVCLSYCGCLPAMNCDEY